MGWMLFVLGLMVGGAMGVTAMAVVFYARGGEAQANFSGKCQEAGSCLSGKGADFCCKTVHP